jgi:hypothetical protein
MEKHAKRKMISSLYQELIKSFFIKIFPFFSRKVKPLLIGFEDEVILKVLKGKKPYAWIALQSEEVTFLFDELLLQYKLRKKLNVETKTLLTQVGFSPLTEKNTRFLNKQYLKEIPRTDYLVESYSPHQPFIVNQLFSGVSMVAPLNYHSLLSIIEDKKIIILSSDQQSLLLKVSELEDALLSKKINKSACISIPNSEEEQWFDKLDLLKVEVMKQDFDLILLDAGLFNVHLAWFVKSMSRQAIVVDLIKTIQPS